MGCINPKAIASYAESANNVVVDYILYEKNWWPELIEVLKDLRVYYVGIKYPLNFIEERESKRETSPVGHARRHYKEIHAVSDYDFFIDDPKLSAKDIAFKIRAYIQNNSK